MAVLAGIPHVSVKVRVAGDIATEHEAPSDQVPVDNAYPGVPDTHCYIEAKTGAEFGVEMTASPGFSLPRGSNAISMTVFIDGTWMASTFISAGLVPRATTETVTLKDVLCCAEQPGGEPSFKKFMFSSIATSDTVPGGDIASEIERAKGLGVIKVALRIGRTGGNTPWIPSDGLQDQDQELPEKALKGRELSHRASLGAGTRRPVPSCRTFHNIKELGAIFFHYLSHEALQREMIIPRSPSPTTQPRVTSSPVEADLLNLSESEIRRLAGERLRDLQVKNEPRRVKREAKSVPREVRPLKVVKLDDGTEAIDLTED